MRRFAGFTPGRLPEHARRPLARSTPPGPRVLPGLFLSLLVALLAASAAPPAARAAVAVSPISCDFGDVAIVALSPGTGAAGLRFFVEAPVRIVNQNPEPVTIGTATVEPPGAFSLAPPGCTGVTLAPGASCELLVRFLPRSPGGHAAALVIEIDMGPAGAGQSVPLLVPLAGDAVELSCGGSACAAPTLDLGAACGGEVRERTVGFLNETGGAVLASCRSETKGAGNIVADLPPRRTVAPGEEYAVRLTARYEGAVGPRDGELIWSVPPPRLPVIREISQPLTLRVRTCFSVSQAIDITARRGAETFEIPPRYAAGRKPLLLEDRVREDGTILRRIAVLGRTPAGPAVALTRARRVARALDVAPWRLLPLDPRDPVRGLLALRRSPALRLPAEGDPGSFAGELDKASPRIYRPLAIGARRAYLLDYERGTVRARGLGLAARRRIAGPVVAAKIDASRAYAIVRREALVAGRPAALGVVRLGIEERNRGGGQWESPRLAAVRKARLAEIGGRQAVAVRAMDSVAVRRASGRWDEALVLAARYRRAGDPAPARYLLLRGGGGISPNAARSGWGWRRGLVALRAKRLADCGGLPPLDQPGAAGGCPGAVLARLAFEDGTIVEHVARRRAAAAGWTWARLRTFTLPHDIVAMRRRKRTASADELIVAGHEMLSRLRLRGRRAVLVAREKRPPSRRLLGLALPRHGEVTARRRKRALVLARERNKASPGLLAYRGWDPPPAIAGEHGGPPVLLSGGDVIARSVPEPGAGGTKVALTAYAIDPDGDPLYWSWVVPGVELDDPTSPHPAGFFPVGETPVYVVVRDGPPDDPAAGESAPALLRVVVEESPVCDDSFFDVNGDGTLDISDAIYELIYLFVTGPPPARPEAADVNGDGAGDISDPIYLLGYLFLGGPPPVCPR